MSAKGNYEKFSQENKSRWDTHYSTHIGMALVVVELWDNVEQPGDITQNNHRSLDNLSDYFSWVDIILHISSNGSCFVLLMWIPI